MDTVMEQGGDGPGDNDTAEVTVLVTTIRTEATGLVTNLTHREKEEKESHAIKYRVSKIVPQR